MLLRRGGSRTAPTGVCTTIVIFANTPSFRRKPESRVKQSTPFPSPSLCEGDACEARRGCTSFTATTQTTNTNIPFIPSIHVNSYPQPLWIPAFAGMT